MNIDDRLRQAADRMNASLEDADIPPAPQRRRPALAAAVAAGAIVAGIIGVAVLASGPVDDTTAPTSTPVPTTLAEPVRSDRTRTLIVDTQFSVTYPVEWQRTREPLAPNSDFSDPATTQIFAAGTGPLVAGADSCADYPENAIRALGADDILLIIASSNDSGVLWPAAFGPDVFPNNDVSDSIRACTDRIDIVAWEGTFELDGEGINVLVASTLTTTQTQLDGAWAALDTFELRPQPEPVDPRPDLHITYPADWYRADSELMPNLGWDSITLSTDPVRPGGERCAHMPENSLRDLPTDGALITVFVDAVGEGQAWPPSGFDDDVFPETPPGDDAECSERYDLEYHWGPWRQHDAGHYLLVAFGPDVSDERRAETWQILSSLTDNRTESRNQACVATAPAEPSWVPPDGWPETPSDPNQRWFGTPDLWTALPIDGVFDWRKSIWWSQNFTDPGVESQPEITVVYERVDGTLGRMESAPFGSNGRTVQDGLFMLADIQWEIPSGCWRITADYKDATLSYVVDVP